MFRVGQKVVCTNCALMLGTIKPDEVLTVHAVIWDGAALLFEDRVPPAPYSGWASEWFRPIVEKKTDISFAHDILRKVSRKDRVRA